MRILAAASVREQCTGTAEAPNSIRGLHPGRLKSDADTTVVPFWTLSKADTPALPVPSFNEALTPARLGELRTALANFASAPLVTREAHPLPKKRDRSAGLPLDAVSPLAQELSRDWTLLAGHGYRATTLLTMYR
ncbi:hypothetical protein GCM10009721_08890 [Terrabacter tumescens]|uniref:Uncharacterized protein n=1 Tax=Terrabacter tumescens TaxID=60443 RepID=A0ABQ2HMP0_9MICO|nr:hypothetical protein GCM10009721_08890 [Terrabacter tumescens]